MSKIVRVNAPKERALSVTTLLTYADFVRASNKVESKIDKLLNMLKSEK